MLRRRNHPCPLAEAAVRLDRLRSTILNDRIAADLALGRGAEVVPELEQLVAIHPFDERLRGHLMVALYRSGRQADALAVYTSTRALLVEELWWNRVPSCAISSSSSCATTARL